jgi:hypothetical protein
VPYLACLPDVDGDGDLDVPGGASLAQDDCNDSNSTVYPGASELCDGLLNDCALAVPDQTCPSVCPGAWPVDVGTSNGHVVIAQLDGDNDLEVVAAGPPGITAIDDDGDVMWTNAIWAGYSFPAVADVNLDGQMDVVHSSGGVVHVLRGNDGTSLATFSGGSEAGWYDPVFVADVDNDGDFDLATEGSGSQARVIRLAPGLTVEAQTPLTVPGPEYYQLAAPTLGDLDGDRATIEIGMGTAGWGCTVGTSCLFRFRVYRLDGTVVNDPASTFLVPFASTGYAGEGHVPFLGDVDGDGTDELVHWVTNKAGGGTGAYVWTTAGAAHPTIASPWSGGQGRPLVAPVDADGVLTSGELHPAAGPLVDLQGDGVFEEIAGAGDGLRIYSGAALLPGYPTGPAAQSPIVGDLDRDGRMEIVYLSGSDNSVHCFRLGTSTWSWDRVAGHGITGWSEGAFVTNAYDPYEPNDPTALPDATTLTMANARASFRAMPLLPFRTQYFTGSGWRAQVLGVLGHAGDRDMFWRDGSGWFSTSLSLPSWSPVDYDLRVHFYNAAGYAGTLEAIGPGGGSVYCHSASTVCPSGTGSYRAIIEIVPSDPALDFGPWPYRLLSDGV